MMPEGVALSMEVVTFSKTPQPDATTATTATTGRETATFAEMRRTMGSF
jgi:hypothetical protein